MEEIVLVESRNPEDVLVRSPEIKLIAGSTISQEPIRKRKRWRKPACILGSLSCFGRIGAALLSLYLAPHAVEVNRSQHSGKSHPSSLRISGGERLQDAMSMRSQVGGESAVERVHHPVGRVIHRPAVPRHPHQCCRSIKFPLPVGSIIAPICHERVLIGRARPVHLGLHLQHPTVIETSGLPSRLSKGVAVVQLFGCYIGIISHDARQLSVVVIIVNLCPQLVPAHTIGSSAHHPVHIQFAMSRVHTTVGSSLMGSIFTIVQNERIVVFGIGVLTHRLESEPIRQSLHIAQIRRDISEGPHLQLSREVRLLVDGNLAHGLDGKQSCHRGLPGRDEDVVVVANGESQSLHLVERITGHINFAALTFTEQHTIVTHARVSRSESTHSYRLHSSSSTIVAQIDAWHSVQGVGHIRNAEP